MSRATVSFSEAPVDPGSVQVAQRCKQVLPSPHCPATAKAQKPQGNAAFWQLGTPSNCALQVRAHLYKLKQQGNLRLPAFLGPMNDQSGSVVAMTHLPRLQQRGLLTLASLGSLRLQQPNLIVVCCPALSCCPISGEHCPQLLILLHLFVASCSPFASCITQLLCHRPLDYTLQAMNQSLS